jgi:PRTRC genetic system protein A
MNIMSAVLAESDTLPPVTGFYQYVVAANGLFIRAADSRIEACASVAGAGGLPGLVEVEPFAQLKVPRLSDRFLIAVLDSARRHLPNEAMYQFEYLGGHWSCSMPHGKASPTALTFADNPQAVVDLHSHGSLGAFFSSVDDGDEQGLRFYVVIGKVDTAEPEILCRAGVYGWHVEVPVTTVFDGLGPFTDVFGRADEAEPVEEDGDDVDNSAAAVEEGVDYTESGLAVVKWGLDHG